MGRIAAVFLTCLAFAGAAAASDASIRLGGEIDVTEPVDGSLHAAGGRIEIHAAVDGDVNVAGGKILVKAPVQGDVHAAGGQVTIDAPVSGDVAVAAGTLELGPAARIAGKVTFRGGELRRDPAAEVAGAIEHTSGRKHRHAGMDAFHGYARGWLWTAGLLVLAALIAAALPGPSQRMASELRERPWLTTLVGLTALGAIPVAAVLLMVTIIGIPLGLLAIVLYAALLLVGYVWLAVVMGGLLLDRVKPDTAALTAWRAGAAVLAMLVLALLARLPYVGGFIVLVALMVGVGMIVAVLMRQRASTPAAPAAPTAPAA